MKRNPLIPPLPPKDSPESYKLANVVARHNPKVYDAKLDLIELGDWIRGMEKIFAVIEVPEEKNVNIGTFCRAGEADIWWSTVKGKFQALELTWLEFLEELKAKFYPITV
mgnify:CR=1 FL=1